MGTFSQGRRHGVYNWCVYGVVAGVTIIALSASANAASCVQDKANKLAECLSEATADVNTCQDNCEDDPDDASAYTQCKRVCSAEEQKERGVCFAADKEVICP
jgi:hypothetical protein